MKEAARIANKRNSRHNPDGWSPVSRLLHRRLRVIGALHKRMADGLGIDICYRMYDEAKRDMRKLTLNKDEKDWLEEHGVNCFLPDWRDWKLHNSDLQCLNEECLHFKSLTNKTRRDELRLLHGGRMRRL